MSNLALSAAPFSSTNNIQDNDLSGISNTSNNHIEKARNRTIKNRGSSNDKVSNMMAYIHKNTNEDENELSNFNPPEPPTSVGAEKRKETDPNLTDNNVPAGPSDAPDNDQPVTEDIYNDLPDTSKSEYYQKVAPLYKQMQEFVGVPQYTNKSELTQKLNYMIHLLEEQQDERTGHVFEELILYSFLGIFIIFVVDSFARAGKYVR